MNNKCNATKEELEFAKNVASPACINALKNNQCNFLEHIAEGMFELETQEGYPKEFFYDDMNKEEKISREEWVVVLTYYYPLIERHKMKSGMYIDKTEKKRHNFCKKVKRFYQTGNFDFM